MKQNFRLLRFLLVIATYFALGIGLWIYHRSNTVVHEYGILTCKAIPQPFKYLIGPLSMAECNFGNGRQVPFFLVITAIFFLLLAIINWVQNNVVVAMAWALIVGIWCILWLLQGFNFMLA